MLVLEVGSPDVQLAATAAPGSQIQYLEMAPASTRMSSPVIISASSEAKNAAALP